MKYFPHGRYTVVSWSEVFVVNLGEHPVDVVFPAGHVSVVVDLPALDHLLADLAHFVIAAFGYPFLFILK